VPYSVQPNASTNGVTCENTVYLIVSGDPIMSVTDTRKNPEELIGEPREVLKGITPVVLCLGIASQDPGISKFYL
jgi:hypothetical protein